ncbi:MAG: NUDIX hydrolase [Planctomycetes bacterium]|nr:NUDIX hydrolase [Planctomycetota bacterium]
MRLRALAQIGLRFARDDFDTNRYSEIHEIAVEMMAAQSELPKEKLVELFEREQGYATPKVDVRGVVFEGEKVLLVKERMDGCWSLPGGWADVGKSVRENVEREIWEEAGLETRSVRLLAVYDRAKHPHKPLMPFHVYKMFIQCEKLGGELQSSCETSDAGFFSEDKLPEMSITRVLPEQVKTDVRVVAESGDTGGF